MIKFVKIKNFKSHKKTKITFTKGVNVIFGNSFSGKSSIISAINWVVNNRPLGDSFRGDADSPISVSIGLDDGVVITKKRIKNTNKYIIKDKNGTYPLGAAKTGVPKEVSEYLRMNDINFQFQFDNHFLVSNNPSEIAKFFNKALELDIIDKTFDNINKMEDKASANVKQLNKDLTVYNTKLNELHWIDSARLDLEEIEKIDDKIESLESQKIGISNIIENVSLILQKLNLTKISTIVEAEDSFKSIIKINEKVKEKSKEIKTLSECVRSINETNKRISLLKNVDVASEKIKKIHSKGLELLSREKEIFPLKDIITIIKSDSDSLVKINSRIKTLEIKLKNIMPEVCPLCGSATNVK